MPVSIAIDDSLDREIAVTNALEFRELSDFSDSAHEDDSAENSAPEDDSAEESTPEDDSAEDEEEWGGIDDDEKEWDSIDDDHGLLQPPDEDTVYETCELLLQQVKKHTAQQGYAIIIAGSKSNITKTAVIKYRL